MKYTVTSLKIIIVGLCVAVLMLLGCASGTQAAEQTGPRRTYTIKVYSSDAQLLSEYKTYKSPFNSYFKTCALDYMTIRFVNVDGEAITIVNGIVVIEED